MSYYHKPENTNNAQRVLEFYHQVLKEFTIKLDKEFRYKGIITSEQIERMELVCITSCRSLIKDCSSPECFSISS